MADENKINEENKPEVREQNPPEDKPETPTVEELMEQLRLANADRDKYKSANDKLSKSEAEMKRQLRAKLTAEEKEAAEKAEAEKAREDELNALRREVNHSKALNAYKVISDEKMVENLIEAVSDADHTAIANIMENYANAKVKEAQAEWQKSRPRVNIGDDGAITKEKFDQMDLIEKSKLYRENKAEYDRLNSR